MIEAVREEPGKPASCQTRYYIASIAPDAVEFAHAARQHWSIENGLHWVLDKRGLAALDETFLQTVLMAA
jgi:predicted transposase YbfD/YdcC